MGLNDFSESSLRDYLLAVVGMEPEASEDLFSIVPSLAIAVHSIKNRLRRNSDEITHDRILAKVLVEFYERGKRQGVFDSIDAIREGIEKIEWESKSDG